MFNFVFIIDVDTNATPSVSVAKDLTVKVKAETISGAKSKIEGAFPTGNVVTYKKYVLMQELPEIEE